MDRRAPLRILCRAESRGALAKQLPGVMGIRNRPHQSPSSQLGLVRRIGVKTRLAFGRNEFEFAVLDGSLLEWRSVIRRAHKDHLKLTMVLRDLDPGWQVLCSSFERKIPAPGEWSGKILSAETRYETNCHHEQW